MDGFVVSSPVAAWGKLEELKMFSPSADFHTRKIRRMQPIFCKRKVLGEKASNGIDLRPKKRGLTHFQEFPYKQDTKMSGGSLHKDTWCGTLWNLILEKI